MKKSGRSAAPQDLGGRELEVRRTQRLQTGAHLAASRTPLQVLEVAASAAGLADQTIAAALAKQPPRPPSACREGCAWCCYRTVGTSAPEVLRIVAYLRQHLSSEELQRVREHIVRLDEQRQALGPGGRRSSRLPCPLLAGDRCSVYSVRPLTCRGFNSSDARRCEQALKPGAHVAIPSHEPQRRLATFVLDGLRAGLAEAGLKGDLLELTAALRIVVTVPDTAERWLAGEPVFAAAVFPGE